MTNAWKVLWKEHGHNFSKTFEGDKPSETDAPAFVHQLKERGISEVNLISKRKAYAPPVGKVIPLGFLWCPYCVKYREFSMFAVRINDLIGPERYRCTVCTVGADNFYVRKYNQGRLRQQEIELEVKSAVKRSVKVRNG